MSGVIVNYNNNQLTSMSSSGTKTLLTSGKYCEGNFEVVYSAPALSSLTVTPTETAQTFNATGVYGYKPVTVNAISSTYVGTGIATRSAANLTASGSVVTAPAGYYSSQVTKSVASATLATPAITLASATGVVTATENQTAAGYIAATSKTSTYTLTTQAAQTLYPSTADRTISSYRWLTGTQTIKSVTTSNLTAENIAEGVVVKVGDANNASRITQVTGTHSGGGKHTCTIKGSGINGQAPVRVVYNNTNYYQNNSSFQFSAGETITCTCIYGDVNHIYVNGESVATTGYTYTLPDKDIEITMYYDVSQENEASIKIAESIIPSGTYNITSNGTYNVYGYASASVNVSGETTYTATIIKGGTSEIYVEHNGSTYYMSGQTFSFHEGDVITFNCTDTYNPTIKIDNALVGGGVPYSYKLLPCDVNISAYGQAGGTQLVANFWLSNSKNWGFTLEEILAHQVKVLTSCNVVSIPAYTFYKWDCLSSVNFPHCTYIYSFAFAECASLTSISFPKCTRIQQGAFHRCLSLSSVYFPECSIIESMAFSSCISLTSISFPKCSAIYSSAFQGCSQLESAIFPLCKSISAYAFFTCSSLTMASFPICTYIGAEAFRACRYLSSIYFPNCNTISDTMAFAYCYSLTNVELMSCTTIGSSTFQGCSSLAKVSLPICTSFGSYVFRSCRNLISLYLDQVSSVPYFGYSMFLSTPISDYSTVAGRYGSIFVPSSLYSAFTTATSWSEYSARMVSV